MSKLKGLIADLKVLPDKQSRKDLVGTLSAMRDQVDEVAAKLADTLAAARNAEQFLDAKQLGLAREFAKSVINEATKLRGLIADPKNIRSDGPANSAVTLMREKTGAAKKVVADRWKSRLESMAEQYNALTRAAEKAQLSGQAEMRSAVQRLSQAAQRPPGTAGEALKVRQDREAVKTAVERLGLEGAAGEFLVAASQGQAEAAYLRDPAVLAFLDEHPDLWKLLKVSLA